MHFTFPFLAQLLVIHRKEKIDSTFCNQKRSQIQFIQMSTIKYTRNTDGHFVCPHCNVVKNKQNTMHYHIKRNHEKNFPFECKQCSENPKFLQRSSYLHHLATNHPENPHPTETEKNQYATTEFACPCCTHKTHTKANVIM